jgi:hypothetical protein
MAIDITLAANTPTATLELRQVQPTPKGAGFAAFVIVRSGGLAAALPYFVTSDALREFVHALDGAVGGIATPARLPTRDGLGELVIEITSDGDMIVSGRLEEGADQLLRFRFTTEARGAATLRDGLRSLLAAPRS